MRRAAIPLALSLLVSALMTGAGAQPPDIRDEMRGFAILPPGNGGGFEHNSDQRAMYGALADDDDITEAELSDYFHDFSFTPADIKDEYQPPGRTDVTIFRDGFNIPHVFAGSDEGAAYALGYATAEDRLWHADVLRHAGLGRLSELLGDGFVTFDKTARRDGYTERQLRKILARFENLGELGTLFQESLAAYAAGMNARIDEVQSGAATKPIEYFGGDVEQWRQIDSLAAAIVQIRNFGGSGGREIENAAALRTLQGRLGKAQGRAVFNDIHYRNDPFAYPSVPESVGLFPSPELGPVNPRAVAIPDKPGKVADKIAAGRRATTRTLDRLGIRAPASNFVSIAGSKSETGAPLQWGGPQVGYNIPPPFMEIAVHSPSLSVRGMTLPGIALFPAIGRGPSHAWSITTGTGDVVDTFVEKLCHPRKRPVPKRSKFYRHKGKCKKMKRRIEDFNVKGGAPFAKKMFRSAHGPVVAWARLNGKPVAVSQQRSYWMKEGDFIAALLAANVSSSVEEFRDAIKMAPMSFNITYADAENVGYFHVGRYPVRAQGVDPKLPVWGKGRWDWKGFVAADDLPQTIDPEQGFVANWNNKPSAGWDSSDHSNWGPTQRVRLLTDQLEARLDGGGKMTLADLVQVMATAATQDSNALRLWDRVAPSIVADPGIEQAALTALDTWVVDGAHRRDVNRDDITDSPVAVAVWDTMFEKMVRGVFGDEFGDTGWDPRLKIADSPPHNNGSSYFFDYSNYLWHLFAGETDGYARNYCEELGGEPKTCAEVIQEAFEEAVADLEADMGGDTSVWTWDADTIRFNPIGGAQVAPLPWQNRGTWNHLVELTGP